MENKSEIPALPGMNGITGYVIEEALAGFWLRGVHVISGTAVRTIEECFGEATGISSIDDRPAVLFSYPLKDYSDYPEA